MSENKKKKNQLDKKLDKVKEQHKDLSNIDKYLIDEEEIESLGEIELYDYNKDIADSDKKSGEIIKDLVDLYLGDAPQIKEHTYIIKKMKEDSQYYSSMKFLEKMSKKLLLKQLKQIDAGEDGARMHEITTNTMKEMSAIIKDGRLARTEIEKLYKEIRKDFGLNETMNNNEEVKSEEKESKFIDNKSLNDKIDNYIKNK